MTSLPSISEEKFQEENENLFMKSLASLDPELYIIRRSLIDTQVNPSVVPLLLRALSNVEKGGGWGKVIVEVRNGVVERCASESTLRDAETTKLDIIDVRYFQS